MICGSVILIILGIFLTYKTCQELKPKKVVGTVMSYDDKTVTVQDNNYIIYTFDMNVDDIGIGDKLSIKYSGVVDKNKEKQTCEVISYEFVNEQTDELGIPVSFKDDNIFKDYYNQAYAKLKTLTLDEKIGQLLLVRYPDNNALADLRKYYFSGFVFFEKDFKNKNEVDVKKMINVLQNNANIPLLTAVDEEGGKVVRVSSNQNLVAEKFKSPSDLYRIGGIDLIKDDTVNKSRILYKLGLNLNLAPVVDVSTSETDYIHERTIKEGPEITAKYAKAVIEASKETGVSYTLKHFPGYANNGDTHNGKVIDTRGYEVIKNRDLPPFKSGIDEKAEAVLMSHNIVNSIDNENPTSLSPRAHNILRNELDFSGIIITDDLAMNALNDISDKTVKAIKAGNDLIITTDYEESFNSIKSAVNNGEITEEQINKLAFKVLSWKYYKQMFIDEK